MEPYLHFAAKADFTNWLTAHGQNSDGVWLLFGKPGGPETLSAHEALEAALSFGWIDGRMQKLDALSYIKYFSLRRKNSKWSEKNKALALALEKQGLMSEYGRIKIEEAKKNGQWDAPRPEAITDEQIALLSDLLKAQEPAYTNFLAMSPSVKKTYVRAYFDAKTDAGRTNRLAWMIERLHKNLKPM